MQKEPDTAIILCPKGCRLKVSNQISGYQCNRGKAFALQELNDPKRSLTLTMLTTDGSVLPVKLLQTIPKDNVLMLAEELKKITLPNTPSNGTLRLAATVNGKALEMQITNTNMLDTEVL